MIVIITGATHTGKTLLAQNILEKYKYPYISIDHLKMGLIRSGNTELTPEDDDELTPYLWPIVREMIKTVIENKQNLVVEGCYVPFDWRKDFEEEYIKDIKFICLAMTDEYIEKNISSILSHASDIESRFGDDADYCTVDNIKALNRDYENGFKNAGETVTLIDKDYEKIINELMRFDNMIREVSFEDIPECVNVIRSAFKTVADEFGFTEENAPRFTAFATDEQRIGYQFLEEHKPMYVYLSGGKIVGYYSLAILNEKEVELNNLSVLPEYRHNGIGRKLLKDCFERVKSLGADKLKIGIVEENQVLRKWYESNGFVHTGTKKFDFFPFTCGYMEADINEA